MQRTVRRLLPLALAAGIACDQGLSPIPQPTGCPTGFVGICGTVRFLGAEPPGTEGVFIVAYPTFPQSRTDLYSFVPFPPQSVPRPFTGSYFYTIAAPTGRYEWVVAVWKQQGPLVEENLREAGFYRDQADASNPGIVVVNGTGTDAIDFVIDFDDMHPVCTYLPPCPP
jgi:hypothetical protein